MFWNKNNKHKKTIFDTENTADNEFGLFYDNQEDCSKCEEVDCCILFEGVANGDVPVLLEGFTEDCVQLEGCTTGQSLEFLTAYINSLT